MLLHNKFKIESVGNSIMRLSVFEGMDIEIDDAREMRRMLLELSHGNKFCVLLDARNRFIVSPEARALIASKEYSLDRIATAFVVTSLANQLVGNFFIKVNKPLTPTKIFAQEGSALEWLEKEVVKVEKRIYV